MGKRYSEGSVPLFAQEEERHGRHPSHVPFFPSRTWVMLLTLSSEDGERRKQKR
jgi:hypothetical protein